MLTRHQAEKAAYLRVFALAVAAFVVNTTEFLPIAMLTDIGRGFNMSEADTGIMITVYAWVVSLASLPLMLIAARAERRRLLLSLFAVFVTGHALSVAAWSFPVLLVSRVVIALTHALFWAITAALAMRLAPRGTRQQALGWLSLGTAMATVLGLPMGRIIGQLLGWRATFALIGILALGVMLLLAGEHGTHSEGKNSLLGFILVLAGSIVFAAVMRPTKKMMQQIPVPAFTALTIALAPLIAAPFALAFTQNWHIKWSLPGIAGILYLGIGCNWLGYWLWNKGMAHVPSNLSGLLIALEPLFGVLMAVLLLHEPLTAASASGIALVVGATLLASAMQRKS